MKKIVFLIAFFTLFLSCNKTEGLGGTSSITGKVIVNDYNGSGTLIATYPGQDEDVFIIYGNDNTTYSDKVSSSFDGTYRFDNLTAGTYKLYAYSKCSTCDSGQEAVVITVEITQKKQVVTAPDIIIKK
jgi:hypothetical protein